MLVPIIFLRYDMIGIIILVLVAAIITWLLIRYGGVKCPKCGGRMKMTECTDTINTWTCQTCGKQVTVEEYDE